MWFVASIVLIFGAMLVQASPQRFPTIRAHVAKAGRFPYHVIIHPVNSTHERFSGSLITNELVLTAASPLFGVKGNLQISVGATFLDKRIRGRRWYRESNRVDEVVPVESNVIIHEEFRPDYPLYDNIALIKLAIPVKFSVSIKPVKLPTVAEEFKDWAGTPVSITGLGSRYRGSRLSKAINYYNTTILSNEKCLKYYSSWERNLCTDASVKGSYCVGTWGSPIVTINNVEPHASTLVGIAMEAPGCSGGMGIVHTQVAPYLYWIDMHSGFYSRNQKYVDSDKKSEDGIPVSPTPTAVSHFIVVNQNYDALEEVSDNGSSVSDVATFASNVDASNQIFDNLHEVSGD